jgi:two-component system, OmpR family, sensor histidine kinase BaeS
MRIRIGQKLFLGFSCAALIVLGLNSWLTRWNFQRSFLDYVNETEAQGLTYFASVLADAYAEDGGWDALRNNRQRWLELMEPPGPASEREQERIGPTASGTQVASRDPLSISPRISVLDASGGHLFGPPAGDMPPMVQPIVSDGKVVGMLQLHPLESLARDIDLRFSRQQLRWIYGTSLSAFLLAAIFAIAFTRQMVSPIVKLTRGTRALTEGHFENRIDVRSTDEVGDLARHFNTLAETLEKNQQSQRQWIADISHELRTPLSILRGELQALEDGVRVFGPDTQRSLTSEVDRLAKLVDDLYELSVSDLGALRYRKEVLNVTDVLAETLSKYEPRIASDGLHLERHCPSKPLLALVDSARLGQLFGNLLENSVRYTARGGTIRVSCGAHDGRISVTVEDSQPSVPNDAMPRLFDRLYRVERSRARRTGGAGLGLAICQSIARAHGGEISVASSNLGGLKVELALPAEAA